MIVGVRDGPNVRLEGTSGKLRSNYWGGAGRVILCIMANQPGISPDSAGACLTSVRDAALQPSQQ